MPCWSGRKDVASIGFASPRTGGGKKNQDGLQSRGELIVCIRSDSLPHHSGMRAQTIRNG